MDCASSRALIQASCDEPLGGADAASLALHVASCADCRRYRRQMAALSEVLGALRSESETVGVQRGADTTRSAGVGARLWWRPMSRVAAAIALLICGALFLDMESRPAGKSVPSPTHGLADDGMEAPLGIDATGLTLQGGSEREFIPVAYRTQQQNVRFVMLYRTDSRSGESQ